MLGVSVGTIGWFDAGTLDVPIAAHRVYSGSQDPIGYSFEVGVSAGLPVVSLIEAYGQASKTATTFSTRPRRFGRNMSVSADPEAYDAAVADAMASGATREQAEAFLAPLFA
jgi:hypothetical protein